MSDRTTSVMTERPSSGRIGRGRGRAIVLAAVAAAALIGVPSVAATSGGSSPIESAIRFPAGFDSAIYVGEQQVWPTLPPTDPSVPATEAPTTVATTAPPATDPATTPPVTDPPATDPPTAPPPTVPPPAVGPCGLVQAAFCDTFDAPTVNPATSRAGDLNGLYWGVSRTNTVDSSSNAWMETTLEGCAAGPARAPQDVRICGGQLYEAVTDYSVAGFGGQTTLAMYPKQPFDISGDRPGTVVFDTNADSQGPHAAWQEYWWTDQPVPAPHGHMAAQAPYARNSFGFGLEAQCTDASGSGTSGTHQPYVGVGSMQVTAEYRVSDLPFTRTGCVLKGSLTALNHVEVRHNVGDHTVEVWASDPGGADLRMIAFSTAPLPLTRGVIWIEDVHYNATKFDAQGTHTFAWDNVGFDGPTPYRDLTFDVPDNVDSADGRSLGYPLTGGNPITVTAPGVYWDQEPTKTHVAFNWFPTEPSVPEISVNGGPWISTPWPFDDTAYAWRTIAVDVPMSDLRVGDNTIVFRGADSAVANINVVLIAATPVPVP